MSPDEPVTAVLVDAMVGRSHEQLAGEIKVLAAEQRGQARAHELASRLSSEEHARVHEALRAMGAKIDTLTSTLAGVVSDQETTKAAAEAVAKWRRRAIGAVVTVITLLIGIATVVATGVHS